MSEELLLIAIYLKKNNPTHHWIEQRGNVFGWMRNCYGVLYKELSTSEDTEAYMMVMFKNWIILMEDSQNIERILPEYIT